MISKFNIIEIAELEKLGCLCTPYTGNINNLVFSINAKTGIVLDIYIEKKGKIVNIITFDNISFEELREKIKEYKNGK